MPEPVLVVARSGLLSDIQIPLPERTYTSSSVQCQTLPLPLILATEGFLQTKLKKKKKKVPTFIPMLCAKERKKATRWHWSNVQGITEGLVKCEH